MYLISWNVAGWSSTTQAIRESYGSLHDFFACTSADIICLQECKGTLGKLNASPVDMGASDPPPSRRPVVSPLTCLSPAQRKGGATTFKGGGVNDGVDGWESFWSFSGKQHRGFNGVVTFARKGLTWRCDNQPFAEEELNEEGRVVVTHHSAFVLVNVYVPNARGGARHRYKFTFLRELESLMERLRRETKKPVILVGDLNMTYRAFDGAWSLRRIHLGTLLHLEAAATKKAEAEWAAAMPHLPKAALQRVVNMVANYFCARVMDVACSIRDGSGAVADASSAPSSTQSPLSPPASVQTPTTSVVSVDAELIVDGDTLDRAALHRLCDALQRDGFASSGSGGRTTQMYEAPPLPLRAFYEAGFRNAYASEFAKGFPCAHNNELYAVVRYCGLSPHSDASAGFMGRLLHLPLPTSAAPVLASRLPWSAPPQPPHMGCLNTTADYSQTRMFDSFLLTESLIAAHAEADRGDAAQLESLLMSEVERPQLHPYCPCPYTVWDQSRNRRLENVGTRLDYILVDAALLPAVECRRETANNVASASESTHAARADFLSEVSGAQYRDGVLRAMAAGAYPPAPFDGSGMPALAEQARALCCAGLPSTGLFVTPPQFSDHIGVGLVLDLTRLGVDRELVQRPGKLTEDHKCMYRPPVGLHTFFAAAAAKNSTVPATAAPSAASVAPPELSSAPASTEKDGADEVDGTRKRTAASGGADRLETGGSGPLKTMRAERDTAVRPAVTEKEAEVVDVDEL